MTRPFLKFGSDRGQFSTQNALPPNGTADVDNGEFVTVSFSTSNSGSAGHRLTSPQGAMLVNTQLDGSATAVNWDVTANNISVTLGSSKTGSLVFLVF